MLKNKSGMELPPTVLVVIIVTCLFALIAFFCILIVRDTTIGKGDSSTFYFLTDSKITFTGATVKDYLNIYKQGQAIEISEERKELGNSMACEKKDFNMGTVIFDPGHDTKSGYMSGKNTEEHLARILANKLKAFGGATRDSDPDKTLPPDFYMSVDDRIAAVKAAGTAISLHTGQNANPGATPLVIYINRKPESYTLACYIARELLKEKAVDTANIVVQNTQGLAADNPLRILSVDKTAILIEIGNIENPKIEEQQEKFRGGIEAALAPLK